MKKIYFTLFAMIIGTVVVSATMAFEFSADVFHKMKGQTMTSRMYMKDKKIRWDSQSQGNYTIIRQDLNTSWVVMPKQKTYMEMKSTKPEQVPQEKVKGEISRKLIVTETIDGHPTKKYEVTYKDGKQEFKSYQWIATDINFPIKTAAVDGSWSTEYKNIKTGSQPATLFELPTGYQKMAMPGAGMDGRMKSGKPPREIPAQTGGH
jgi:hypothetical protein